MAGDFDYLVHVVAADVSDYERIHRTQMARLPHVANVRSSFALRSVVERGTIEARVALAGTEHTDS
jgi:DNA-binding Lrp family transcriptional regulator